MDETPVPTTGSPRAPFTSSYDPSYTPAYWPSLQFTIAPTLFNVLVSGGAISFSISNLTVGATNTIERSLNLATNGWTAVSSFVAASTSTNWSETLQPGWTKAFYRAPDPGTMQRRAQPTMNPRSNRNRSARHRAWEPGTGSLSAQWWRWTSRLDSSPSPSSTPREISNFIRLDMFIPVTLWMLTRLIVDRFGVLTAYQFAWGVLAIFAFPGAMLPGPLKLIPAVIQGLIPRCRLLPVPPLPSWPGFRLRHCRRPPEQDRRHRCCASRSSGSRGPRSRRLCSASRP